MKVLFIGNSHTYFNEMVYLFKSLVNEGCTNLPLDVCMLAHSGRTLQEHAAEPEVRFNILYGDYDYVVLQQVAHPFPGRDVLFRDAAEINRFITKAGAKPVLYMTWAEKAKPWNQDEMTNSYTDLAKELHAILCPVGLCWQWVLQHHPEIDLFHEDGGHASAAGSYLAACAFYSVLMNKSPEGLSGRIMNGNDIICDIPGDMAHILQQTAWRICHDHNSDFF